MKKFITGLILGAELMIGFSVHAEVTSLVGSVIEGQFPVKIDGTEIEAPGVVVNGTSYLPVRTMGELLGYDVKFDADMGVELKKKPVPQTTTQRNDREDIEAYIQRIEEGIQGHKDRIEEYKMRLELTPNLTEEARNNLENGIKKEEEIITTQEKKLQELKAQLEELNQAP